MSWREKRILELCCMVANSRRFVTKAVNVCVGGWVGCRALQVSVLAPWLLLLSTGWQKNRRRVCSITKHTQRHHSESVSQHKEVRLHFNSISHPPDSIYLFVSFCSFDLVSSIDVSQSLVDTHFSWVSGTRIHSCNCICRSNTYQN